MFTSLTDRYRALEGPFLRPVVEYIALALARLEEQMAQKLLDQSKEAIQTCMQCTSTTTTLGMQS